VFQIGSQPVAEVAVVAATATAAVPKQAGN